MYKRQLHHFTFSVDFRKFRTPPWNWLSKHTNVIMCKLFFRLFTGPSQNKLLQSYQYQLSVATSLTYLLPISLTLLMKDDTLTACTSSRKFCSSADARMHHIPHVESKNLCQCFFSYSVIVLQSKAMAFSCLWHLSHLVLPCLQNCIKNSINNPTITSMPLKLH